MDNVEMAQESLEHAHGHHDASGEHAASQRGTRRAAVLVAIFAAVAVIVEMSANDAQTTYLARTITSSDIWNEYQAKSVRRAVWLATAQSLGVQSGTAPSPQATAAIAGARASAARLEDDPANGGMKQLASRAHADEHERDHALHRHEQLERSVRVLQIAIVLIGLYLATRVAILVGVGTILGLAAIAWGIVAGLGLV